jgi:hypothetical protein
MTEEKKTTGETKLYEEKKVADPFIAGFIESMAKTNTEKITKGTWRVYVAKPPELFQLKCLSHTSGAATHLNRNNS